VTSWRDYPAAIAGITEPKLLAWFADNVRPGETWLDVGAHYGYTAISLSTLVGASGRVFAFEPMASTVGCLARTRFINRLECLTIVPMALGAVQDLEVERFATIRGMADRTLYTSGKTQQWNEMIYVARLDWLWPRLSGGNSRIDGIKIDVQGMELQVLRGMRETLLRLRPKLVVELHQGVDRGEVLSLLESVGYSRDALPIEPVPGEDLPQFLNDRSYAFSVKHDRTQSR
jgi:FkbM family methyltransferase